mgnify:CR=1 FL=1
MNVIPGQAVMTIDLRNNNEEELGKDHTIEQFAEMNRQEYERFGKLIRAANIKAE